MKKEPKECNKEITIIGYQVYEMDEDDPES